MSADLVPSCDVDISFGIDVNLAPLFTCEYARELYVGGAGDVVATMIDDQGVSHTYMNVPAGSTLSGKFVTVLSSGTTAFGIVARR
jgi:hypothetical protein